VVAEDSTAYGLDIDRKRSIHTLIAQLADVDGIDWIRLMYAYPHTVLPALTTVMREHPKVVPYLDIPIQHIASDTLRAMKRGVSSQQVRDILWRLRDEVPGIAVRTTLIVGFPGETEAEFSELKEFVAEYRFERMGAFTFSREEGTPAFDLADQIDAALAEARRDELMTIQRGIMAAHNQNRVGQTLPVLIDGRDPASSDDDTTRFVGRTMSDAPEIDGVVRIASGDLRSGDLIRARITGADDYDLRGVIATE